MKTFPVGSDAVVEIPFVNNDGDPVTPTGAFVRVRDSQDEVILAQGVIDISGTSALITVPAATFAAPGGYTVELTITVGSQTFVQEELIGITPIVRLEFLKNTFQSRASAAFIANTAPNVTYFAGAVKADQELALTEAFRRITLLNFFIPWPEIMDLQNRIAPRYQAHITPRMWPLMDATLWQVYPQYFKDAMSLAQVVEANNVLTVDPLASRRAGGLFSEKIGESSIMFKSGIRPLEDICGRATMGILTQFLNTRITTARS